MAACMRQSTITNTPTSTMPAASSPNVATVLCGICATLTASAATPMISSDQTGTFILGMPVVGLTRASATGTNRAISTVRTAIATNAQRQMPNCANRPPVVGPTTVATPHIADTSAEPRVHNQRGRAELMTA